MRRLRGLLGTGERPAGTGVRTRRRAARRKFLPSRRVALRGGGLVAVLAGAFALWHTGLAARLADQALESTVALSAKAGFVVETVYADGRQETPRGAVLEALGVERGLPLVLFDPKAARARLEALGWVRTASVERHWPDAIYVRLVERRPMARWQHAGKLALVDREGVVIGPATEPRFGGLPLIVGAGAPKAAPALFDLLANEPQLFSHITACVRIGERRWNLELDNGIAVMLPEEGVGQAWARLAELVREEKVFDKAIVAIDLRLADRLVLRLTPEAAGGPAQSGRNI